MKGSPVSDRIIHIGMHKTGTTSLQKNVFPFLPEMIPGLEYNPSSVTGLLRKIRLGAEESLRPRIIEELNKIDQVMISWEWLIGRNPNDWKRRADLNLDLFGRDSTIVLTLRPTHEYLRSIYQQAVHEGNVSDPDLFFVRNQEWITLSNLPNFSKLTVFDVDSLDYEYLINLYKERFRRVLVVNHVHLAELSFLSELFEIKTTQLVTLSKKLESAKSNRSYSDTAMKLTFLREKILNLLSLSSLSVSGELLRTSIQSLREAQSPLGKSKAKTERDTSRKSPFISLAYLIRHRVRDSFSWRGFIQKRFDKVFPYRPYQLPEGIYQNTGLAEANDKLLAEVGQYKLFTN